MAGTVVPADLKICESINQIPGLWLLHHGCNLSVVSGKFGLVKQRQEAPGLEKCMYRPTCLRACWPQAMQIPRFVQNVTSLEPQAAELYPA